MPSLDSPKSPAVTDVEHGRMRQGEASSSQTHTSESLQSLEYRENTHSRPSRLALQWRRAVEKVPTPIARWTRKAVEWTKGPQPPRIYQIKPLFERVQTSHIRIFARIPKSLRIALFLSAFVLWVVLFGVVISNFSLPGNVAGFGAPVRLACVSRLWPNAQSCGLDGGNCLPFSNSSFAFSCPADCAGVSVLNPYTIGDQQIVYRSLVVGGGGAPSSSDEKDPPIYRGDSFICGAAIHAGIIQDSRGGCGVLSLTGSQRGFGGVQRNGIESVGFNSSFPLSFMFNGDEEVRVSSAKCRDPRWNLLVLSTIFTALFSLFTTTPATFFFPIFTILYFQIAMASDPQPYSDYPSLASSAIGNFLPAAFIGYLIYRFAVRKTLTNMHAQLEKTILWVGGAWVGALSNVTLEKIPIQRLTPHDLNQQPGAIVALIVIILVLVAIAIYQAWCFRVEGRLRRYLALYVSLGVGLLILLAIPDLELRIHHYILALLLLPGTALQTRPSLLYQGLLVGLFINGVARWGFAPILETAAALRGDARIGRGIPDVFDPVINATHISFSWGALARGFEGVSVVVNDVERFRSRGLEGLSMHVGGSENGSWNGTGTRDGVFEWERKDEPQFFRFGFVKHVPFGGVVYSDFTRAGTLWANGTWSGIPKGRS